MRVHDDVYRAGWRMLNRSLERQLRGRRSSFYWASAERPPTMTINDALALQESDVAQLSNEQLRLARAWLKMATFPERFDRLNQEPSARVRLLEAMHAEMRVRGLFAFQRPTS